MRALDGIRILDLTRLAPGPFCTMILADMGADVLRIVEPGPPAGRRIEGADELMKAFAERLKTGSSPLNALHRNKRNMALNLKDEEARGIFLKLAEKADIIVEEFRPGVTERLGIDYATVKAINPRIIYCAITGYGQDGPYSQLPGHDINYLSIAGVLDLIGEAGSRPVIPLNVVGDFAGGGLQGVIGILLALVARQRTGVGQFVDVPMTDGVVSLLTLLVSEAAITGNSPKRGETYLSGIDPCYAAYLTKDRKYVSLACVEPWFYASLCRALNRDDLITLQTDVSKRDEVRAAFQEAFLTRTRDEWFEFLSGRDVCIAKVNTLDELQSDPHLAHRKMLVEVDHPTVGKVKQVGIAIKLSNTPGEIRTTTASPGEHTDEALLELGYDESQIRELRRRGAVGQQASDSGTRNEGKG